MSRIYLLVEGQTEEAFVRELLQPHYAPMELYLTPIIVSTSPGYKGGMSSYSKIRPQIQRLCRQDAGAYVSTMFDLYALPDDFPGRAEDDWPRNGSGHQKASFIEQHMADDIGHRNFLANILVHEFEALLFVQPERFADWADDDVANALVDIRHRFLPEDLNDNPATAPSKRILGVMPEYQKTVHGPLIACDIGLDAMRAECPHFAAWLQRLEATIN